MMYIRLIFDQSNTLFILPIWTLKNRISLLKSESGMRFHYHHMCRHKHFYRCRFNHSCFNYILLQKKNFVFLMLLSIMSFSNLFSFSESFFLMLDIYCFLQYFLYLPQSLTIKESDRTFLSTISKIKVSPKGIKEKSLCALSN